jgi:hypothetical protein
MSVLTKLIQKGRPRSFASKSAPLGPLVVELQDKVDLHDGVLDESPVSGVLPTIATAAGTTEIILHIPHTGVLVGANFVAKDVLATNDTNYVTFGVINKSNSNAAMLAATDVNTTKLTGGTALAAYTRRALTLNATAANLRVTKNDIVVVQVVATGTLANTVTEANVQLQINPVG